MLVAEKAVSDRNSTDIPCQYVKGVGPKRALLFKKLGLERVSDLLYLAPRRYEDRRTFTPIRRLHDGEFQTIQGKIVASGLKETRRFFRIFQLAVEDESGVLFATWFNQPYLQNRFKVGDRVILSGKVQWYGRELQMMAPDYEVLIGDTSDLLHTGRIVPIYPLTEGISQRAMRLIVKNACDLFHEFLEEIFSEEILRENHLMGLKEAIITIHFPESFEGMNQARRRLAFEEFFMVQLWLGFKKKTYQKLKRTFCYEKISESVQSFVKSLPFPLTQAQVRVISEIGKDLQKEFPMNRLLQGDVGSGKTLVACASFYMAVRSGFQGVLMVPTEVLAQQHRKTFEKIFQPLEVKIGLLLGDEKVKIKRETLQNLSEGNIQILVGTHSLLEEKVSFQKLGMVIIDEQHKFGVVQRALLRNKGFEPDVLIMTATPIPRTLALTVYGDLEVSVLDQMPPGRGKVSTYWIKREKLNDAYHFIHREVEKGAQAYIIYPLVEESEKSELKAATQMFHQLSQEVFRGLTLGLIHGRMSAEEKNEVIYQFRDQKIHILVSTTVIEVGIDIPNASLILIENADAFGLAQLHQLRGRVGRGPRSAYCILEAEPRTEEGIRRLEAMVKTRDGFKIAEADLTIRGPGEFLGTRQHGLPEIRFGHLLTDHELIHRSRQTANAILDEDPFLKDQDNQKLHHLIQKKFLEKTQFLSVG
ncbi:MAG: ATP-dependent DNA helicase RecG [Chlamydiae bacterium]|nr:ATP-dependent DNA helicase RecG [Chlamydiota bacterium]MBI3278149.1 ATP-dependent DNA helicase RecG [Chlamydiota bacterium]